VVGPEVLFLGDKDRTGFAHQPRSPRLRHPGGVDEAADHHPALLAVADFLDVAGIRLAQDGHDVMPGRDVLGIAKRAKAKILQASTSEVYGDPEMHPQNESYWGRVNPIGIRSCYDEGKRAAECLMMDYRRQNGVNTKIARIFNTYGPRMAVKDGRVVSNFIIQALQGVDITVYGDGSHTRSFCYVDDMVEGLIRMMNCADDFYGPVNLGNPEEFTILELARLIIKLTKSASKIIFQPLPMDDPTQRKPNITLAGNKLGWKPKVNLEKGLKNTIEYFRDILKHT